MLVIHYLFFFATRTFSYTILMMIDMIYIYTNGTKDKDFGSKGTIQELCNDKALPKN